MCQVRISFHGNVLCWTQTTAYNTIDSCCFLLYLVLLVLNYKDDSVFARVCTFIWQCCGIHLLQLLGLRLVRQAALLTVMRLNVQLVQLVSAFKRTGALLDLIGLFWLVLNIS